MNTKTTNLKDVPPPHDNAAVLLCGNTEDPKRALILFHGRYSNARNIMNLAESVSFGDDVIVLAPEATGGAWYPKRFFEPRAENEPHLGSALEAADALVRLCKDEYGIPPESVVFAGFSQGACLTSDYIARNPRRYGGVCIYSGGLIGSEDEVESYAWTGSLEGTPVYIGCDDNDPHIPYARVVTTGSMFEKLGADTTVRLYTYLGHTVHPEGIEFLEKLVSW